MDNERDWQDRELNTVKPFVEMASEANVKPATLVLVW